MPSDQAFEEVEGALRVRLRLQPGASAERIEGLETLADGACVLKVRVGAPPEGGKANAALMKLFAKQLKVSKGAVSLESGQKSRRKTIRVAGDSAALAERLAAILKTVEGR